jgi:GT2 family glycosyltransferase
MLGYTSGGTCRVEFLGSVLNAVSGPECDPAIGGVISSSAGPLLALGRNLLVEQFLSYDLEWLCTVDTDIVFATDAVSRLLADADPIHRPIMSALYYIFEDGQKIPAAYVNMSEDEELDIHPIENIKDDQVVRVFSVGAGFLLVHRSVFETIKKDSAGERCWFREGVIAGRDFGEDVSFCIRAAISSFPVYVNTGVKVGHVKSAMLGEVK